jgi:hypothetical protein
MRVDLRSPVLRTLLLASVAVLFGWAVLRTNVLAANVTASWSYDYSPAPACSAVRSTNCIDHFEVDDITNQQDFVLIQTVPNPSPAGGKIDHISSSFKYGPPFGQRTISVIAVGKGPNGQRLTSNPFAARVTVSIRPGAKTAAVF